MGKYLPVTFQATDDLYIKCMGYEEISELAHWGPGYREHCILHYVVRGSGFFNGHQVFENQGFFISDNQLHEYHSDTDNPWNYFWLIFSSELAEKYVYPLIKMNSDNIFTFPFKGALLNLCQNIFHEYTCLSNMQALSYFFKLMSLHESLAELQPRTSFQHVTKAKLYIENNFNKNITVRDVAREIFVNERYLYNLFMKYEKVSIKDYINLQRYSHACELLSNTQLAINEIAHSVGYHDVFAFSKFFTKQGGLSPTKYRESILSSVIT